MFPEAIDPSPVADVADLAGEGLSALSPQVLTIGTAGIVVVLLFTVYGIVTTAIKSKGKRVG